VRTERPRARCFSFAATVELIDLHSETDIHAQTGHLSRYGCCVQTLHDRNEGEDKDYPRERQLIRQFAGNAQREVKANREGAWLFLWHSRNQELYGHRLKLAQVELANCPTAVTAPPRRPAPLQSSRTAHPVSISRLGTRAFRCNSCTFQPNTFCRPSEALWRGDNGAGHGMFGPETGMKMPHEPGRCW
jgi:hypothetical protein